MDGDGRGCDATPPEVGSNFHIDREEIRGRSFGTNVDDDVVSLSSLSAGGITTITKLVGDRYGGLELRDVEDAGGDDRFDDDTTICPSTGGDDDVVDDYAYAVAYAGGHGRSEGIGGPSDASSGGASSVSSITNDCVPTYDAGGTFLAFRRRGEIQHQHQHQQRQQQKRTPDPRPHTPPRIHRAVLSSPSSAPWHNVVRSSSSTGGGGSRSDAHPKTDRTSASRSTAPTVPNTPERSHNPLGDDFVESQKRVDRPSSPPHDGAASRATTDCDEDDDGRSVGGFGAHVYRHLDGRRRGYGCVAVLVVLAMFAAVLIAIAALDPGRGREADAANDPEENVEVYDPRDDIDPSSSPPAYEPDGGENDSGGTAVSDRGEGVESVEEEEEDGDLSVEGMEFVEPGIGEDGPGTDASPSMSPGGVEFSAHSSGMPESLANTSPPTMTPTQKFAPSIIFETWVDVLGPSLPASTPPSRRPTTTPDPTPRPTVLDTPDPTPDPTLVDDTNSPSRRTNRPTPMTRPTRRPTKRPITLSPNDDPTLLPTESRITGSPSSTSPITVGPITASPVAAPTMSPTRSPSAPLTGEPTPAEEEAPSPTPFTEEPTPAEEETSPPTQYFPSCPSTYPPEDGVSVEYREGDTVSRPRDGEPWKVYQCQAKVCDSPSGEYWIFVGICPNG